GFADAAGGPGPSGSHSATAGSFQSQRQKPPRPSARFTITGRQLSKAAALRSRHDGKGMRAAELRILCLAFPGSVETFPFGPDTSVFKVAGKMFALSGLAQTPLRVSLQCEPQLAAQLRQAHRAVLPGYHL